MGHRIANRIQGIYQITNKVTGKKYIGSSIDVEWRIEVHRRALIRGNHQFKGLQADFNKYSPDDFSFEIIELTDLDEVGLSKREIYHTVLAHKSEGGCYNPKNGNPRRFTRLLVREP